MFRKFFSRQVLDQVQPPPWSNRQWVPWPSRRGDSLMLLSEFWNHVDKTDECWPWTMSLYPNGYGQVTIRGQKWYTHRLAYTLAVGNIPAGLVIDHLCRTKNCCNPDHMEVTTRGENVRRHFRLQTHCKHGHFIDGWTRRTGRQGSRYCRTCDKLRKEKACLSAG